jgi:hypothetical protein
MTVTVWRVAVSSPRPAPNDGPEIAAGHFASSAPFGRVIGRATPKNEKMIDAINAITVSPDRCG